MEKVSSVFFCCWRESCFVCILPKIKFCLRPEILPEREEENDIVEDESELILERIEEEMAAEYSDDEDDALIQLDDLHILHGVDVVRDLAFNFRHCKPLFWHWSEWCHDVKWEQCQVQCCYLNSR